jgi:hypothetical protein
MFFVIGALGCGGAAQPSSPTPKAGDAGKTDAARTDASTKPPPKVASTPRETLIQATEGLFKPDEAKLFKVVQADDAQKAFLKARVDLQQAGLDFRAAFLKQCGEKAWEKFQDPKQGSELADFTVPLVDLKYESELAEKYPIDQKGDEAFAELNDGKGRRRRCRLVNADDRWLLDAASITPPADQIDSQRTLIAGTAELIRKYQRAIGKQKPEDIDFEMGLALKRLLGFDAPSQKFDVDKLKD